MNIQPIKQRYGIIGNSPELDRAIEIAAVVAPTDLSVLIVGESGTGKEVFPQIIHQNSQRKHGPYNALNCGAIPEGTIDSELFGHEKGSFTGAHEARKGYFEVSDGGTLFLDEVGELPLSTQVRLLRVLETGEFIRVGSSKAQKTNVRVVAATNVDMRVALKKGTFREDLYYRLNAIPIIIPPLRDRPLDIHLLFRKFAVDSAERYRIKDPIALTDDAQRMLSSYRWPGNVRQLRNIVEQMNVIEKDNRTVDAAKLRRYLPEVDAPLLPALIDKQEPEAVTGQERELMLAVVRRLQEEVVALKSQLQGVSGQSITSRIVEPVPQEVFFQQPLTERGTVTIERVGDHSVQHQDVLHTEVEETLSLEEKEKELIKKALVKHRNKRKSAAQELGISERTLYRKIKEYDIS